MATLKRSTISSRYFSEENEFPFEPLKEYEATLDKKRWLTQLEPERLLIEKAISIDLEARLELKLAPAVVSYRKGFGAHRAIQDCNEYVREHFKNIHDPKKRGLSILKRDIRSYTDRIPLGEDSPLWERFEELNYSDVQIQKFKNLLRPIVSEDKIGGERCLRQGVRTGSPLTPGIANLYALPLDSLILSFPNVFYRRYGDDLLIIHQDAMLLDQIDQRMSDLLHQLKLEFHPGKSENLFLCGSGFANASSHVKFRSASYLDYLGMRIHAFHGVRMKPEKLKELLQDFKRTLCNTLKLTDEFPLEQKIQLCVKISNDYFGKRDALTYPRVHELFSGVTDEGQMKELDHVIARILTQTLTGNSKISAYRTLSWKSLIKDYGWKSPRFIWSRRHR